MPEANSPGGVVEYGGGGLEPLVPDRVLDTRKGIGAPRRTLGPDTSITLQVAGRGGVPATGAGAVVLNVTAVGATARSYITAWPTGAQRPETSNLNVEPGDTVPNLVVVKLGTNGTISLYNAFGNVNLLADIAGWFPEGTDASTRLVLKPGTILGGSGDVISYTGSSETGGTVTLAASADLPNVGGHLAVAPHSVVPDGIFGRVSTVTPLAGGTHRLALAPSVLEAAFADIESAYAGPVFDNPSSAPGTGRLIEVRPECGGTAGVSIAGDVALSGFNGDFDFDLSDRYLRVLLEGAITITLDVAISGGVSCTIEFPSFKSVFGVTLAEYSSGIDVSLTGTGEATVSATAHATLGFAVNGNSAQDLSDFDLDGEADGTTTNSLQLSVGPFVEIDAKLFGLAGVVMNVGADVTGSIIQGPPPRGTFCAEITFGIGGRFSLEAGRWGFTWSVDLVTRRFGPWTLYETPRCGAWVGTISYSVNTSRETLTFDSGDVDTLEHDFAWTVTSTSSTLLNETYSFGVGGTAPADARLAWQNIYWQNWFTWLLGEYSGSCRHSGTGEFPGSIETRVYDTTFQNIFQPEPGQTIYLRIYADYSGVPQVVSGDWPVACGPLASGPIYARGPGISVPPPGDLVCLPGTVMSGGECLVVARVSDDGRSIRVSRTMNGVMVTGSANTETGTRYRVHDTVQVLTIDLRLI